MFDVKLTLDAWDGNKERRTVEAKVKAQFVKPGQEDLECGGVARQDRGPCYEPPRTRGKGGEGPEGVHVRFDSKQLVEAPMGEPVTIETEMKDATIWRRLCRPPA